MAGSLGQAVLELVTDDSKYAAGIDKAEGKASRLSGTMSKVGTVARVAGGFIGGELVGALSEAANKGADEEASLVRVQQAIENTGQSYADHADEITAVIDKGKQLGFANNDLHDSYALLVEQTGSAEEAIRRMEVAENLARGAHIDLYSASKLLGKATDENANVLGRYGIHVEKGADVTKMLAEVQAKFGGQATAYGNTVAGAIDRTKVSIEGWQASIGNSLGPAQQYIALLPGISSGMGLAGGAIGAASGVIKGSMIPTFLASVPATIAMMAPFAPLIIAIAAIGAAALALKWAWDNNFGDIQGKTAAVFGFLGGAFEAIKSTISTIWGAVGPILQSGVAAILAPIRTVIDVVRGALELLDRFNSSRASSAENSTTSANEAAVRRGYASGTSYVPQTGLALLHQGEAVLTAEENANRGGTIHVPVYLDSRLIADVVGDRVMDRARQLGGR